MILRTPPLKKRKEVLSVEEDGGGSNRLQMQLYEGLHVSEDLQEHSLQTTSDQMLCTYQCRQMVKSEFFDALSSAEKQAHDYQSKYEARNEEFSKVEAETKKLRSKMLNAEQEVAASKGREQIWREKFRKEADFCQEQLKNQIKCCSDLEVKLQKETDLRRKAESSAAEAAEKAVLLEEKLSTLSESHAREMKHLENELAQLRSESKLSATRIKAEVEKATLRAESAEKESALLKQQLESTKQRLNQTIVGRIKTEQNPSVESPKTPSMDMSVLVKHLQEELRSYESEVREARQLKTSHGSVQLLKEKLREEKTRRERAEFDLLKLAELQSNVDKMENELSTWKTLIKEIPGVSSADDILCKVAGLQKEVIESMMRAGDSQARLKEVQVALDAALLDKKNADCEATMLKDKAESYKAEIKRLELMVDFVKEERDHLANRMNNESKEHSHSTAIQELESSLAKKENYVTELQKSLSETKESNACQQNEIKLLNERLTNEAKRIKMLEREGDRLRAEISLLESKIGQGDFSAANTKVLRMVNTLAAENETKRTIEALQDELQKTKERLQAAEELKKQSPNAGGTVVDSHVAGTIRQLKEQIATLEKREERYKTVFAEKISVFRRACCELFGYKIIMDDHMRGDGILVTRFTLHSIYAMNDDEMLQFEYESGNTTVVENEYTSSHPEVSRQVDIFVRKMNSIPAFTANLTVESFNKRTLS